VQGIWRRKQQPYVVEPRYFDGHANKVVPKFKRSRNHFSKKSQQKRRGPSGTATITSESLANHNGEEPVGGVQDKDDEDCEVRGEAVVELGGVTEGPGQHGEGITVTSDGDCQSVEMTGVQEAENTVKDRVRILPRWEEMEPEEFDAVAMDWIINSENRGVCIRKILNEYFDNPQIRK
jgi:hypothetical protein